MSRSSIDQNKNLPIRPVRKTNFLLTRKTNTNSPTKVAILSQRGGSPKYNKVRFTNNFKKILKNQFRFGPELTNIF